MESSPEWDFDVLGLCCRIREAVDQEGKINEQQCLLVKLLADCIQRYMEIWITLCGEEVWWNLRKELFSVLENALQLIILSGQKNSSADIALAVLGFKGELNEIIDDARVYAQMINRFILNFPNSLHNVEEQRNYVENLKIQVVSDCNSLQSSIETAYQQDKKTLIRNWNNSPVSRSVWSSLVPMLISAEPKISDTDLSRQEKVGQGSFGTVETAQWHKLPVAVKNFTDVRYFHDELAVYKNLLHADSPHIVRMLGYSTSNLLVLELMSKDLKEHITGLKSPLPLIQSLHLILQIAKALRHLHNMDVVHRDLKPANVLLKTRKDGSLLIKLTDFGISKHSFGFATSHTCFQGTMMYMAPEMLAGSTKYSRKVDVYSFGLISLEILAGKVRQNREEELTLPKDIPKMLISLINSCMEFNDVKRPGFDEICDSLWLVKEEVLGKVKITGLRGIRIENFPSASAIHPNQDNANSRRHMFLPIISPCSTLTGKRAIYALSHNDICKGRYSVTDLPVDILVDIMLVGSVRLIASGQLKIEDRWNTLLNPYESIAHENRHPEDLGIFGQFKKLLKDQGKKFNLYLYIGGWDNSECFSTAFSTATTRTIFVNSVVGLLKSYPIFNGLVIDWSYISDNGKNYGKAGNVTSEKDVDNLVLTLEVLRKELPVGSFMIALTCTSSAAQEWPIEKAIHLLDQIHVNLPVISSKITSHRSALYASSSFEQHNTDESVKMYISHGIPSSKIFIVGSLDSMRYADTDGIGMPAGSWNWDPDYKGLPEAGSEEKWDDEAKAAYAHHPIRRVIDTYDDNKSMVEKAKYIKENDLGGILVLWAHNDFPYMHERSTMKALHKYLTHS